MKVREADSKMGVYIKKKRKKGENGGVGWKDNGVRNDKGQDEGEREERESRVRKAAVWKRLVKKRRCRPSDQTF